MKNGAGHRIAFYAPMKSPRHPVPSGDREMARNLITRLEATGAAVSLCSELRIFDKTGSAQTQETLRAKAKAEI
ncbi:MAG: glycosyltransferase family 1 protein, partial [Phaeobacter italicus]